MTSLVSPLAALASAATLGIADFTGGLAARKTPGPSVMVGLELCGFAAVPLGLWLLPVGWDTGAAVITFAGGALGGLGLLAFYRAMSLDLIGVVAPITGVVAAALPTVTGVLTGEPLHAPQFGGIAVGLLAIALVNGGPRAVDGARRGVVLAILAGIAFGMFFILFHAASNAGLSAFVSGRLGSGLVGLVAALVSGVPIVARRSSWPLIAAGGIIDGAGVVLYLYASRTGLLSLTALLASFYPAFTILCARLFTRERLNRMQAAGAVLAVAAVALIAAS